MSRGDLAGFSLRRVERGNKTSGKGGEVEAELGLFLSRYTHVSGNVGARGGEIEAVRGSSLRKGEGASRETELARTSGCGAVLGAQTPGGVIRQVGRGGRWLSLYTHVSISIYPYTHSYARGWAGIEPT